MICKLVRRDVFCDGSTLFFYMVSINDVSTQILVFRIAVEAQLSSPSNQKILPQDASLQMTHNDKHWKSDISMAKRVKKQPFTIEMSTMCKIIFRKEEYSRLRKAWKKRTQ